MLAHQENSLRFGIYRRNQRCISLTASNYRQLQHVDQQLHLLDMTRLIKKLFAIKLALHISYLLPLPPHLNWFRIQE
jgi:hypothetical protein